VTADFEAPGRPPELRVHRPARWCPGGRSRERTAAPYAARRGGLPLTLALCLLLPVAAAAQQPPAPRDTAARRDTLARRDTVVLRDSAALRPDTTVRSPAADSQRARQMRGDSVRPRSPITPGGAFVRSLILPGWGQARLGRNVTGGLFVLFEGMAGAMVWKATWQLEWARTRDKFVDSHRQEREDWIVLLVFNHLMAAAEAYVSALLYDYPVALQARALPGGRTVVGVTLPLR